MANRSFNPDTHMHEGWSYEDEGDLQDLLGHIRESHPVEQVEAFHSPRTDSLHLDRVIVQKSHRKQGHGSEILRKISDFADKKGKTVTLQTAQGNKNWGTTSQGRLGRFYRRFGFRDNYGKRDYRPDLEGDMHRPPVDRHFYDTLDEIERFTEYRSAAIYSPRTGQIFEGPMHLMAHDAAARAGHPDAHAPKLWEDGFMTHDGVFHDRKGRESVDMMSKGQLPLAPKGAGDRPDIRPEKAAQLRAVRLRGEGKERYSLYRSAAVRSPNTGKIYEGTWHGEARSLAANSEGEIGYPEWEDGFVTHGGDFHDRDQADIEAKRVNALASKSGMHMGETVALMGAGELDNLKNDEGFNVAARGFRKFLEGKDRHFYDALEELERFNLFRSAAIKHKKTGEVYEGTWHEAAREAAKEEGHDPWGQSRDWEDGFVNHDGEFLDRDQARVATRPDPEHRTGGQDESVQMMIAGNLPVDEGLIWDPDLHPALSRKLNDHLRSTGRIDFDEWRQAAGFNQQDSRARRRDPFVEVSDLEDRLFNMPTEEGTK